MGRSPEGYEGPASFRTGSHKRPSDILVAGSLAVDFSCDYAPLVSSNGHTPQLHTSNPAIITQTVGGVGYNVALAAHLIGASVNLCTIVADDVCGKAALSTLKAKRMDTSGVLTLDPKLGLRSAQYIAVNDARKDLVVAMADMSILENSAGRYLDTYRTHLRRCKPSWVVVDSNWHENVLRQGLIAAKASGARVALEPVSAAKATRMFNISSAAEAIQVVPNNLVDIVTPNTVELAAMYNAARESQLFESSMWWDIIDKLGMSASGSRKELVSITNTRLVDDGIPQQSIQLLPFMPCILTKLGASGVLLTELLGPGDRRLTSPASAPYILSRSYAGNDTVGGVYMRLFPPAEVVPEDEIVSVNGIGDTFLGIIIAGLAMGGNDLESLVQPAQQGSVMSLKSREAVSPDLSRLRPMIQGARS